MLRLKPTAALGSEPPCGGAENYTVQGCLNVGSQRLGVVGSRLRRKSEIRPYRRNVHCAAIEPRPIPDTAANGPESTLVLPAANGKNEPNW